MFYQEYAPAPILQSYIDRYWIVETSSADTYPMEHNLTPNGLDGLVLQYHLEIPQIYLQPGISKELPANYVLVQPQKSWKLKMPGISGIIGVFFKPGVLQTIFRYPMIELSNQPIELEALAGNRFRNLCEQLPEIELSKRIRFLEEFLIIYLNVNCIRSLSNADIAVKVIMEQKGNVSIQQLANHGHISRQYLSRQFAEKIGISPKHFARIVRFNALHRFLAARAKTAGLMLLIILVTSTNHIL